jgi:hypothetical protein
MNEGASQDDQTSFYHGGRGGRNAVKPQPKLKERLDHEFHEFDELHEKGQRGLSPLSIRSPCHSRETYSESFDRLRIIPVEEAGIQCTRLNCWEFATENHE